MVLKGITDWPSVFLNRKRLHMEESFSLFTLSFLLKDEFFFHFPYLSQIGS